MPDETCSGTKKDGGSCQSTFVGDDGYCPAHRPGGKDEMRERGRRGGIAAHEGKGPGASAFDVDALPLLTSHEAVQVWHEEIARAVAAGTLSAKAGNTISRHLRGWVEAEGERFTMEKVRELEAQQEELKRQLEEAADEPWKA